MLTSARAALAPLPEEETQAAPSAIARPALPPIRVLTCGSVDDGKSTLLGRLLFDATKLPQDQRAMVLRSPLSVPGGKGEYDYSRLLDGLEAERQQGITIDIAWRYADLGNRRLVIIDAPGHEQYTRNMATGASQADLALLLIDARNGVTDQTRRHAAISALAGVPCLVGIVNKMDLADWSRARFEEVASEVRALAAAVGYAGIEIVPAAALHGANVTRRSPRTPWYRGPTLLDILVAGEGGAGQAADLPFRFPVQMVLRDGDARHYAGTVASGRVAVGDAVVEPVAGVTARVARIVTFDGYRENALAGEAVTLVLDTERDVSRGAVLSSPAQPARSASAVRARALWMAEEGPGAALPLLRTATDTVPLAGFSLDATLDPATLQAGPARPLAANALFTATLTLARPTALDEAGTVPATGRFLLVDPITGATLGAGVVEEIVADGAPRCRVVLDRAALAEVMADLGGAEADRAEIARRGAAVVDLLQRYGVPAELWLGDGI